jgi:phosphoribosylformylglycinamidine cyclo-ligase
MLKGYGVGITSSGGETADVGDIVRTIDVGYTTFARSKKDDLIINDIRDGNVIVGLASYGQSIYEGTYNGGMGSNGLTLARHDVFSNIYAEKYPESYDPNTDASVIYTGSKNLLDTIEVDGQPHTIGKLVLSPTRTYLPVLKKVIDLHKDRISGIIHNTGGAHTKVLHFVDKVKIIKDNLLEIPPLFKLIQSESGTDWKEMYKVLNMGTRLEIYTDEKTAGEIIDISKSFNIDAQIIGRVEQAEKKSVVVKAAQGEFVYH